MRTMASINSKRLIMVSTAHVDIVRGRQREVTTTIMVRVKGTVEGSPEEELAIQAKREVGV